MHSRTRRLCCTGLGLCAWGVQDGRGPGAWERRRACAPRLLSVCVGWAADPRPSQALGWSRTPGSPSLSPGAPGGAPALAAFPASPHAPHPWHCLASPGQGASPRTPLPCWAWRTPCPCTHLPPSASHPGAAQGEEKSLGASTQSATLSNLRPDTEYVVTLRPRYAQQPAVPATVTARTRKHRDQPCAQPGTGRSSQHRDAPPVTVPHGDGAAWPMARCCLRGPGWGCR